jgi:hypothetical protein
MLRAKIQSTCSACAGTEFRTPGRFRCVGNCSWQATCRGLRCTNVFLVKERSNVYEPMTVARLGTLLTGAADSVRWRLVAEFLEEYRWEPAESRTALLEDEPARTGDEHWDVFLAALAEHVAARDGRDGPAWAGSRSLRRFWFPFNGRAARVDAVVHAPAAFRRRGVFVARQELEVA